MNTESSIMNILSNYDILDVISKLSALNLLPFNQNKAIVFDYIIDLALQSSREEYKSTNIISNKRLEQVVQLSFDYNRIAIDPAEMPFIQRVQFYGDKWIFCGINTDCGYNLQNLVNSLFLRKNNFNPAFIDKARRIVKVVLNLSDSIVHHLGYSLDILGHYERETIDYPSSNKMNKLQNAITFRYSELRDNLDEKEIVDFFSQFGQETTPTSYSDFSFCKHPFLRISSELFICLNPSLLASFAVSYIIKLADEYGAYQQLIEGYNNETWNNCKLNLQSLEHYGINEESLHISLNNNYYYKEKLFSTSNSVSNSMILVFFIGCSQSVENDELLPTSNPTMIIDRFNEIIASLPLKINHNRLYVLIICNSIGETVIHGFSDLPEKHLLIRPFELQCISVNESGKFLLYYIEARNKLQFHHSPFSDALDSISYFVANRYSFYTSDDIDLKESYAIIGMGDAVDYINDALKKENRQLVERYNSAYFTEVIVHDIKRMLFRPLKTVDKVEILLRLKNADIWVSSQPVTNEEEIDVYYTLVDVISYWLAEFRDELAELITSDIELKNYLTDDIEMYYHEHEDNTSLIELLKIERDFNTIRLFWSSTAYYALAKNGAERTLTEIIIDNLLKDTAIHFDSNKMDKYFSSPLKQRMQILEGQTYPYLRPISGQPRQIPHVYEDMILDEIGQYFRSSGIPYGVITIMGKAEICNKIVEFLYNKLKSLVSEYSCLSLCLLAYYDLEVIMFRMMQAQKRYSYEIECYPEKRTEIEKTINELNKSSIAIKFLVEYVSSVPSSGQKDINELDYEYLVTVCSQIIEWANTGDLFYNDMIDIPIELLKSNRIGMDHSEVERLMHYNYRANTARLTQTSNPLRQSFQDPWDSLVSSEEINAAFYEEYGYSFSDLFSFIMGIIVYGDNINAEIKQANISDILKCIPGISEEIGHKILGDFCNVQRSDFLQPPKPFSKNDVYPWRFNRRLAFIRRPIIMFDKDLIWGNRQLFHSLLYLTDIIKSGKLAAAKGKLKVIMSKMANKVGNDFNSAVVMKIKSLGFLMVYSKVDKINHNKIEAEPGNSLGDIDVLLINPKKHRIVVIEVKEFSFSKTPYEIHREYLKLFCDTEQETCYITKHKRRVQWIKEHISDVIAYYGLQDRKWTVSDALVVNQPIVCNDFYHHNQKILLYSELSTAIINNI